MFVRKDTIKTIDEYIKDCERMKGTLTDLQDAELDAMIEYAKNLKRSEYEYIWVQGG